MLDGTLSRMSFCTIYTDDDRMPLYGIYDDKYTKQVQEQVALLNDAKGLIVCKKANALIAEMLEENRGSIRTIAAQVGYDDVYHFSKLFKKYYGVSPLYYRKSVIEEGGV